MKTLYIIIQKKWQTEIAAGRKKIEYRAASPFWRSRLMGPPGKWAYWRAYDAILFRAGYRPGALELRTGYGGARLTKKGFEIKIGKILKGKTNGKK
jgi:hypothetical protein